MRDAVTPPDSNPQSPQRAALGCLTVCVMVFLVAVGLFWLIGGEILIPYKGVYITGVPARVAAVLWIVVAICLSLPRRSKRNTRGKNVLGSHRDIAH